LLSFIILLICPFVSAAALQITPDESRWFLGLALAFAFTALSRASVLAGREKPLEARAIFWQSTATGFAAMAIVYGLSLAWPKAPNPNDSTFLAGMVALGSGIGWIGAEYIIEPLLERWRKTKGVVNNG
jgi:hypothetical protein